MTNVFLVAGASVCIVSDAGTPWLLKNIPEELGITARPELELTAHFPRISSQPSNRTVIVSSVGDLPALTVGVLLERLRAFLHDLFIIHGNSVLDRVNDRPILLIGHSGIGKSTLTRELASMDRFAVHCEDSLLIRTNQGEIHPFPRVASLRVADPSEAVGLPAWPALGGRYIGKVVAPHDHYSHEVISLESAAVFMLTGESLKDAPPNCPATETTPETFVLSSLQESLIAVLRTKFSQVRIVESTASARNLPMIAFDQGIQGGSRSELFELLAKEGAMVIRSFHNSGVGNVFRGQRPAAPMVLPMRPFAALRHFLEHEINFAVPDIESREVNDALMQLARAFRHATFHNLVPGGSPGETTAAIIRTLDFAQP